jgi:hypothetical protein
VRSITEIIVGVLSGRSIFPFQIPWAARVPSAGTRCQRRENDDDALGGCRSAMAAGRERDRRRGIERSPVPGVRQADPAGLAASSPEGEQRAGGLTYAVYGLIYGVLSAFTMVVAWQRFAETEQLVVHEAT